MSPDPNLFLGISLTASFIAGVLALFAPCCITFLLPSYFGTIFRDRKKVLLYTLLFALGLSFILIPIALGFRFFVFFLDAYHKQVYYLGGAIMVFMGLMTIWPVFHLPQIFHVTPKVDQKTNAWSVFVLGLMSGLTSACCAPVLFAAVTLTTLSPTLFQALLVSIAYVLGIVFPLMLISMSYSKMTGIIGKNRAKIYKVFQVLGVGIFFLSGITITVLNYFDKIQMNSEKDSYGRLIRNIVFDISKYFQNRIFDLLIFSLILFAFYKLIIKFKNYENKGD
ncbi:cytochrome c biogenesis protein CcdA [bacterium]|nr:MAG: cytochrome c biogenesis protein CcdA [bacterium]